MFSRGDYIFVIVLSLLPYLLLEILGSRGCCLASSAPPPQCCSFSGQIHIYDFTPEPFRSCLACFCPFFDSADEFACGYRVWIALPRLIVPVVLQLVPLGAGVPVIACRRQ